MDSLQFKICSKCGKCLPLTEFHKDKSNKDGHYSSCKNCKKGYYEDNKEMHRDTQKEYYKENKEKKLNACQIYRKVNKERIKIKDKLRHEKYYMSNRNKELNRCKKYRKLNPEQSKVTHTNARAKKKGIEGSITLEQWKECLVFFDYKCAYSGQILNSNNLSVDHIKPFDNGGLNLINNIVPAARSINSAKRNNDFIQWYKKQKFYSEERAQKIIQWANKVQK